MQIDSISKRATPANEETAAGQILWGERQDASWEKDTSPDSIPQVFSVTLQTSCSLFLCYFL